MGRPIGSSMRAMAGGLHRIRIMLSLGDIGIQISFREVIHGKRGFKKKYMIYKMISVVLIGCLAFSGGIWHNNMEEAKGIARKEHRHILLNFSGSDWCGPCIMLRREILDAPAFLQVADTSLVLVNADFPRMKKNRLPAAQQGLNDALADQYNPQGKFPYTLLLNADGKVLRSWDGYPAVKAEEFGRQVLAVIDADR